jgi:hypothetical protein
MRVLTGNSSKSLTNATINMPNHGYYKSIFEIINTIRKYYSNTLARRNGSSPTV